MTGQPRSSVQLASLTTTELPQPVVATGGARPPTTLLVPLGATEQHGPHLPLGTDTVIANRWAEATARALRASGVPATVAPTLPYGSSGEHQAFAGTLSIGQQALTTVLIELARSAASTFDRVVFLSGHAGNVEPVSTAVATLVSEGHRALAFVPTWPPEDDVAVDAHAGRTETSLMLHLDPDSVRRHRLAPGNTRPLAEILPTLMAHGVDAASISGVLGDPSEASAAEGAVLMTSLVTRTVEALMPQAESARDTGSE